MGVDGFVAILAPLVDRTHDHHRCLAAAARLLQVGADLKAVHLGQHGLQQDQVRVMLEKSLHG